MAATTLLRVSDSGAFAMPALDAELRRAALDERDAALATEIVYGSLRVLPALDAAIAPFLKRDLSRMDGLVRAVLRAAAYQLHHLSRVPAHAVVHDSVGFIRRARGQRLSGFANAVLRRLARQRPADPHPPERTLVPSWLQRTLVDSLGEARAEALLLRRPGPPPLCLAAPHGRRDAVARALGAALPAAEVAQGELSSEAVLVRRGGNPRRLTGHAAGDFWVQEEGAQLVALSLGAAPGERIADLCAGHGGKTLMLASRMGGRGRLTAVDNEPAKLAQIEPQLTRLGLSGQGLAFETRAIDLRVGVADLPGDHDRVLVDAPCTGLGTLHRRPELLLRLSPQDPARMARLQGELLARAIGLVRPGGRLTYAVCSLSRAEGAGVASALEAQFTCLKRRDPCAHLSGMIADSDGVWRIGPWLGGSVSDPDGYQVVSWEVSA